MEPVMAKGPFSDLVDKVFNSFLKSLEKIFDGKSKDDEKSEKGKITLTTTTIPAEPILDEGGNPLSEDAAKFEVLINISWPDKSPLTKTEAREVIKSGKWDGGKIDLTLQFKNANKVSYSGIRTNQLNNKVSTYVEEHNIQASATKRLKCIVFTYNEITDAEREAMQNQDTSASNRLQISLKKVTGSSGVSINLTKINANYDISDAMNDVSAIVSDDAFVDQLPEGQESSYEITSDEEDYDVESCDSNFSCQDSIHQIIWDTMNIGLQLRVASMTFLKSLRDDYYLFDVDQAISSILDTLSDALQDTQCDYIPGLEFVTNESYFSCEDGTENFADELATYLDKLQVIHDCVSVGIQYRLSEHINRIESFLRKLRQK